MIPAPRRENTSVSSRERPRRYIGGDGGNSNSSLLMAMSNFDIFHTQQHFNFPLCNVISSLLNVVRFMCNRTSQDMDFEFDFLLEVFD